MIDNQIFDIANISADDLNLHCSNTMNQSIGLEFTKIYPNEIHASMVVGNNNCQPLGHLNGGASLAAVEIVGSMAANLVIDREQLVAVGQNIQGSHFRPALMGERVTIIGKPLHIGKKSHVWEVELFNEKEKLICKGSITMAVISRVQ